MSKMFIQTQTLRMISPHNWVNLNFFYKEISVLAKYFGVINGALTIFH